MEVEWIHLYSLEVRPYNHVSFKSDPVSFKSDPVSFKSDPAKIKEDQQE